MLFPTSSHQDLCAMANELLAARVNPLRLYSLTLPTVCKRQTVPCGREIRCHKHFITAVINWQKGKPLDDQPSYNWFNNRKIKNYFDKALGVWCHHTTRETKSQEITCLVLCWDSPTLLASASYLQEEKPKSPPPQMGTQWILSCYTWQLDLRLRVSWEHQCKYKAIQEQKVREPSEWRSSIPQQWGKIFPVSSEIRISSQ